MALLYRFDSNWGHNFRAFVIQNDKIKGSVSSCYAIRNSIAHGGAQSLGPTDLKQYFGDAFNLIVELERLLRL